MKKFYLPQKRCVTSDNSHYSIVKELLLLLSTKCRNFNIQFGSLKCSSFNFGSVCDRGTGGGEGIRTPDPCVANAVLCQLSYTPDNNKISEVRYQKSEFRCRLLTSDR